MSSASSAERAGIYYEIAIAKKIIERLIENAN
jgi:hypothetical protein